MSYQQFEASTTDLELIKNHLLFQRHKPHFPPVVAKHLAERISATRAAIANTRNKEIIADAWASIDCNGEKNHIKRSGMIFEQQLRHKRNQLDEVGESQINAEVEKLFQAIPTLSKLCEFAEADGRSSWASIEGAGRQAADTFAAMSDEETGSLALDLSIPGQTIESKILRMRDPTWMRKRIRKEVREYRAGIPAGVTATYKPSRSATL